MKVGQPGQTTNERPGSALLDDVTRFDQAAMVAELESRAGLNIDDASIARLVAAIDPRVHRRRHHARRCRRAEPR